MLEANFFTNPFLVFDVGFFFFFTIDIYLLHFFYPKTTKSSIHAHIVANARIFVTYGFLNFWSLCLSQYGKHFWRALSELLSK